MKIRARLQEMAPRRNGPVPVFARSGFETELDAVRWTAGSGGAQ